MWQRLIDSGSLALYTGTPAAGQVRLWPVMAEVQISTNFEVDFDRNLAPTWGPTGGQKGVPESTFSNFTSLKIHLGAAMGPKALRDTKHIDFQSIFDRILIFFLSIFLICFSDLLFKLVGLACFVHWLLNQAQWRDCRRHLDNI